MAILEHQSSNRQYTLNSSHLVGRSDACTLRLDSPQVSLEHAAFHWNGAGWELKDLASRNGTLVGQHQLAPGQLTVLEEGARVAFGDPDDIYVLIDAGPPEACAYARDGVIIHAEDGLLALPSEANCLFLVHEDEPGQWFVQASDGSQRAVDSGDTLTGPDGWWRLSLPQVQHRTDTPARAGLRSSDLGLHFAVSLDEEDVVVTVTHRKGSNQLDRRANSYLLLTLARERLRDSADPDLPEPERGWIARDTLMRLMPADPDNPMTAQKLTMEIYRVRKRFQRLGVVDHTAVIERRWSSGKVRLAIADIEIAAPGTPGARR